MRDFPQPMLDALCARIRQAGGALRFWGVLSEDTYETAFGDGRYLHLEAADLDEDRAHRLANAAGGGPDIRWHVMPYTIGIADGLPTMLEERPLSEEFDLDRIVEILLRIPLDGTSSGMPVVP